MLGAMRAFCRRNQPVLCSPFVLTGANTPASTAPVVAQLNAEALSALAYTQAVAEAVPPITAIISRPFRCNRGAPMAGTPEIISHELHDRPIDAVLQGAVRTSNLLGGPKVLDAQAGYESAMTMMAVLLSGANHIWRSAGWNEAGVHCSVAKFMVDCEVCAMGHRMTRGIRWDDFRARQLLADYEEPSLDAAKDEELRAYISRRSREIPAVEALTDEY